MNIKKQREALKLSQKKLSILSGIDQVKISNHELEKKYLSKEDLKRLNEILSNLDTQTVRELSKKRIVTLAKHESSETSIIHQHPRRSYSKTERNGEYLKNLNAISKLFKQQKSKVAVSFFSGLGGLCYGASAAGFNIVAACEKEESFCKIHTQNFKDTHYLTNNICHITEEDLRNVLEKHPCIDLMVGGPPCQGFSLAGKRDTKDSRNILFKNYLRIAKVLSPKIIVMENVKMLTTMKDDGGELIINTIKSEFRKNGYQVSEFVCNAKNYGVPQSRNRVFFIGVRDDLEQMPSFPKPLYEDSVFNERAFSFGDAVSDLKYLESGEKDILDPHHSAVKHPEHVLKWLYFVSEGKSAHENPDEKLRPPSGYNTTYKRQVWSRPSATVSTTFGMISGSNNVHPIATRALTVREALRLQSFPDSFVINGKLSDVRTMIGNAVPPMLAYEICKFLRDKYLT